MASEIVEAGGAPRVPLGRLRAGAAEAVLAQHGTLLPWVPVCLACGIGGWFALPVEPGAGAYVAGGAAVLALALAALRAGGVLAPLLWALALVGTGAGLAGIRAHGVAAPVLGFRYYGPIEGRIVGIDRSTSDAVRLTLDRVRLDDVAPDRVPERVRLSLHGEQGFVALEPGLTVMTTGHLSPPGGPVEPDGFDFRRLAWFQGLGAVGYTRVPVLARAPPEEGRAGLALFRLRMALSHGVQARVPGPSGAFIAAILTGDRSSLPRADLDALRGSNLAHLLAISGLHMGLLTGVVFFALRAAMAAWPRLALRSPIKKLAAVGAMAAGAFYLALSGGNVATVRAFVMISVVLGAVLLERRAISLRTVAVAATLVLAATPEALSGPGFQMSFAATVALVAAFGLLRDRRWTEGWPRWRVAVLASVLSSAVAGAATAPFGAAHFNTISDYGLIANLLCVPLMGLVVMPAAVAAAALWPLGLEEPALQAMHWGAVWILAVAERVSGMTGAITRVPAPGPAVLPCLAAGALVCLLWRGRARWAGLVPVAVALALWTGTTRPAVLVAETGGLVGVLTPEGRVLSKARGDGFAATVWLENDGDGADQAGAAARRAPWTAEGDVLRLTVGERVLLHATGAAARALAARRCGAEEIVVVPVTAERLPEGACLFLDAAALRETGAVSIDAEGRVRTVRAVSGRRLWSGAAAGQ